MAHQLVLPFFLYLARHLDAMGDASSSTIGAQWGSVFNDSTRHPLRGTYSICVLEAGTLLPNCEGTFFLNDSAVGPPVPMLGIASGGYFSCGLRYDSGVPVCWGSSSTNGSSVPSKYQSVRYTRLAVGQGHVCGLRAAGATVDCWGYEPGFESQVQTKFTSVAAGWGFTCGLTEAGKATCWGGYAPSEPPRVVLKAIYAGGLHACGIENNTGLAFCWGSNDYLQANSSIDYQFSSMALGVYHSCGILRVSQQVLCWGDDTFSQVSSSPRNERFSTISAGDSYTCGVSLTEPQRVKCWGNSVIYTLTTTKVSQGICTSSACGRDQYRLATDAAQCPRKGDRICLECPGGTGCNGDPPAPAPSPAASASSKKNVVPILVGALGGTLASCVAAGVAVYVFWGKMRRRRKPVPQLPLEHQPDKQQWHQLSNRVIPFDSLTLRNATFNYSSQMVIGNGANGVVYKAIRPEQRVVAIKKEVESMRNLPDTFSKEIELLSRLHHTFLTNLVGFCEEDNLLVFEFMENGSLSDCLFEKPGLKLNLALRIRIASQAARALEYLHLYASPRIIHRDIKSKNVLLDKDWNAHISDFGVSTLRSGPEDTHLTNMTLVGSPGYIDPAYFQTMQLNSSSDVYSFGVVLMELLCGRKAIQHQIPLASWVKRDMENPENVFDRWLLQSTSSSTALATMLALALECTHEVPGERPTMSVVAQRLEVLLSSMDEVPSASCSSALESSSGWSSSYSETCLPQSRHCCPDDMESHMESHI